jgi:hypothetical protein
VTPFVNKWSGRGPLTWSFNNWAEEIMFDAKDEEEGKEGGILLNPTDEEDEGAWKSSSSSYSKSAVSMEETPN